MGHLVSSEILFSSWSGIANDMLAVALLLSWVEPGRLVQSGPSMKTVSVRRGCAACSSASRSPLVTEMKFPWGAPMSSLQTLLTCSHSGECSNNTVHYQFLTNRHHSLSIPRQSLLIPTICYSSLLFATHPYYLLLIPTICYSSLLFTTPQWPKSLGPPLTHLDPNRNDHVILPFPHSAT